MPRATARNRSPPSSGWPRAGSCRSASTRRSLPTPTLLRGVVSRGAFGSGADSDFLTVRAIKGVRRRRARLAAARRCSRTTRTSPARGVSSSRRPNASTPSRSRRAATAGSSGSTRSATAATAIALDAFRKAAVAAPDAAAGRPTAPHRARAGRRASSTFPRFAAEGVIASMQPTHATSDMPWAEQRVGPERIRGAYAWQSLKKAGARLAGGSDFPVESENPLLGFYAAVTRQDPSGQPPGGWRPQERLSRAGGARALHDRRGLRRRSRRTGAGGSRRATRRTSRSSRRIP